MRTGQQHSSLNLVAGEAVLAVRVAVAEDVRLAEGDAMVRAGPDVGVRQGRNDRRSTVRLVQPEFLIGGIEQGFERVQLGFVEIGKVPIRETAASKGTKITA